MALEEILRRGYTVPDIAAAELNAIESTQFDPDKHISAYLADERSFNGRYVCADLFKETFADTYAVSTESRGRYNGAVHNSAAVLAAEQYRRMLSADEPDRTKVVFLTGSPGAGKTSSVLGSGELDPDIRVLFEGQMSNPKTATDKIQQALDAGLGVHIIAVHPLPENALDNTLNRFYQEGRGASVDVMARIQGGLSESLEAIRERFGDAVSLTVIDRRDFENSIELSGWEHLPVLASEGNYEQIRERLRSTIEQYREQGIIDERAYQQATGGIVNITNGLENGIGPEQNANRSGIQGTNSQEGVLTSEDLLLESAQEAEREQQAILENATPALESYPELLNVFVETKQDQAERIEDRLERLIDKQQAKLQQTLSTQPGIFSMPGAKRAWQAQQAKQQARLQSLHARLEQVQEIAHDMGVYVPRIEELATRKLRAEKPELAAEWDEANTARRHQELMDKQNKKQQGQSRGTGISLGLKHD